MIAPPNVRMSRHAEIDAISAILSDAFVNEDGLNYWLKQGREKDRVRKRFFDAAVRDAINPKRDLWVAEANGARLGAAIWLAPGLKSFDWSFLEELMFTPLFFSISGIKGMARARELGQAHAIPSATTPRALGVSRRITHRSRQRRRLRDPEGNACSAR